MSLQRDTFKWKKISRYDNQVFSKYDRWHDMIYLVIKMDDADNYWRIIASNFSSLFYSNMSV